jgi:hypothetical protein
MSTPEPSQLFAQVETLLDGIDRHEDHPGGGWWQTPDGAKIGRIKLRELKELIGSHLRDIDCAERIADAMEEDGDDPDFPDMDEISRDDLLSAAQTIRRYVYFKKTQEDDSND